MKVSSEDALRDLLSISSENEPAIIFYRNLAIGECLLRSYDNPKESLPYFIEAVSFNGPELPNNILLANKYLTLAYEKLGEWDSARLACIQAVRIAKSQGAISFLERLTLKGELSWIYWQLGDRKRACQSLIGYVLGLVQVNEPDDPHYREAYNKVGHSLGWYSTVASVGTPPPATRNGEPYTDIFAGMFSMPRPLLRNFVRPEGFLPSALLTYSAVLAIHVDLPRTAWSLYKMITRPRYEALHESLLIQALYSHFVSLGVEFGTESELIDVAIDSVRSDCIGLATMHRGIDILQPNLKIPS